MLGKGAKRKLDEDEEGLEGKALAVLSGASPSAGGGCPEGPSFFAAKGVSYTLQRQTIFNISLLKLYSQRSLTEPSLQRRVLINNMLRRIQDELKQEGALRPLHFPAPSPGPAAAPHDHHPLDEGFRQASSSPTPAAAAAAGGVPFGVLSSSSSSSSAGLGLPANGLTLQPPPQAGLTPASLLEEDAGAFGALPPPPAPSLVPPSSTSSSSSSSSSPLLMGAPCRPLRDSFSSALDEIEELCPSAAVAAAAHMTTSLSPSPLSVSSAASSPPAASPSLSASSLHLTLAPALVPSLALSASDSKDCGKASSPKPDVVPMDTLPPPAELDMSTSPSSCTASAPSSCTTSSSSSSSSGFLTDLALDDILFADIDTSMYDFDPCTSASGGAGASKLSPVVTADDLLKTLSSPGVTPSQPFKMDLTELDHIMEVLVGS